MAIKWILKKLLKMVGKSDRKSTWSMYATHLIITVGAYLPYQYGKPDELYGKEKRRNSGNSHHYAALFEPSYDSNKRLHVTDDQETNRSEKRPQETVRHLSHRMTVVITT